MDITQHPRFRWVIGMYTTDGHRILDTWTDGGGVERITWASSDGGYVASDTVASFMRDPSRRRLDLTDAATVGCLYHLYTETVGTVRPSAGEDIAAALVDAWSKPSLAVMTVMAVAA